jgi:hypothetical protein
MMRLDAKLFFMIFQVHTMDKYTNMSIQHAQEAYEDNPNEARWLINEKWLKTPKPKISRWPKNLPCSDFKEDVCDMITLLSRVKILQDSSTFQDWMYKYIRIIRKNKIHIY